MNDSAKCPQCGATLTAAALNGLCPACLLQQGATADTATQPPQPAFEPPPIAEIAKLFPQMEIIALVGKGGMGAVYKARQPALDRFVALKILPAQTAGGTGFSERFNREARALARLGHPSIVAVHEFGQKDGLHYFIMEYVDGVNLRQLEVQGRLSPREALQIIPQICDALQYAHDEGVVHRDIKPENVLVDRKGRVKIADFGLAKILAADPQALRLTGEGQVMGTPHYMAPEQIEHPLEVDHRADIYSLGVVFYEMLTGELPLGKFAAPSRKVQVDVRLDDVVLKALEKEPQRRYQQASEVKTEVQSIATTAPAPSAASSEFAFGTLVNFEPGETVLFSQKTLWALTCKSPPSYRLFFSLPPLWQAGFYVTNRRVLVVAQLFGVMTQQVSLWYPGTGQGQDLELLEQVTVGANSKYLQLDSRSTRDHRLRSRELRLRLYLADPQPVRQTITAAMLAAREMPVRPAAPAVPARAAAAEGAVALRAARWRILPPALVLLLGAIIELCLIGVVTAADISGGVPQWIPRQFVPPVSFGASLWLLSMLAVNVFSIVVAIRLILLRSHGLGFAAAVLCALPDFHFIRLAVGAWLLIALLLPRTRRGFELARSQRSPPPGQSPSRQTVPTIASAMGAIALALIVFTLALRAFVLAPFEVINDAVSPEIPRGSRALVSKRTRQFSSNDLVVYRSQGTNLVGRVTEDGPREGVLKIARRGAPPEGVPVRDIVGRVVFNTRTTQTKASTGVGTSAEADSATGFGPVIERLLYDPDDDPHTNFLVFESGQVFDMPVPWQNGRDLVAALNALGHGMDLLSDASGDALMLFNGGFVPLTNATFDTVDAAVLRHVIPLDSSYMQATNPPRAFLFRTTTGNRDLRGVLEITGFTPSPKRAVKLRYKLLISDEQALTRTAFALLTAMRENNLETLRALACEDIEGWTDALPQFAGELREALQVFDRSLDALTRIEEVRINGDFAAVKTASVKQGYLVLFFHRKGGVWRNAALRNSPPRTPLEKHLNQHIAALRGEPGFGPVVERVVADLALFHEKPLIDLDTGTLFSASAFMKEQDEPTPAELARCYRTNGIDAIASLDPNVLGLVGWDFVAVPVAAEAWTSMPPAKVLSELAVGQPGTPVVMSGKGELPATFAFRTREGGRGLLQIVEITTQPRGLRIRFKLL